MSGAKYLAIMSGPDALTAYKAFKSSNLTSDNRVSPFPEGCNNPALLISNSKVPYFCLTCSEALSMSSWLVTSNWSTSTLGMVWRSWAWPGFRQVATTFPLCASMRTKANPRPLLPPWTKAVLVIVCNKRKELWRVCQRFVYSVLRFTKWFIDNNL